MDIQQKFESVASAEIINVISEGLTQIYHNKPLFPVTYLAHWLNSYSETQKIRQELIDNKKTKQQRYERLQQMKKKIQWTQIQQIQTLKKRIQFQDSQFQNKILQTKYFEDLLHEWLPQYIQKSFHLTGAYVGKLEYRKKPIEEGNFEVGAQNDIENPKVVTYIGASRSHQKLMIANTLPNGRGISYRIFQENSEENNQQNLQQLNPSNKKTYIYINNVLRQPNLHFFKFPKLGSYVCYPIKVKTCLNPLILQKGIVDYKAYLKAKEQTEKQYNQKITEAKAEAEEAQKRFQQFQVNEQDPSTREQKTNLEAQAKLADQKLQQILNSPPVIQEFQFDSVQRDFFIAGDTLGQDKQILQEDLQKINYKVHFFIKEWQKKERKLLLTDILTHLEEQVHLQTIQNVFHQLEKNIVATFEPQIKEQFINKQKQAEFELSLIKCQKIRIFINEPNIKSSMQIYLRYNVPKYTEIIQIWCMLLNYPKQQINLPQSNQLDYRKIVTPESFKNLLEGLQKYQLRRLSSESVSSDYKISRLLQRLEKIESQVLSRYNGFLFVLHHLLRTYCWTRILCRDAKKEQFEAKTRQKEDRDNQIHKWQSELQKNLEATKGSLDEEAQQNFNQEDWRKIYELQNPKPELLEAPLHHEFLDIQ